MSGILSDEKRKELFAKRKYYSEHPEEAHKEALKRKDDGVVIFTSHKGKENK